MKEKSSHFIFFSTKIYIRIYLLIVYGRWPVLTCLRYTNEKSFFNKI